jgi:hypothetical protein
MRSLVTLLVLCALVLEVGAACGNKSASTKAATPTATRIVATSQVVPTNMAPRSTASAKEGVLTYQLFRHADSFFGGYGGVAAVTNESDIPMSTKFTVRETRGDVFLGDNPVGSGCDSSSLTSPVFVPPHETAYFTFGSTNQHDSTLEVRDKVEEPYSGKAPCEYPDVVSSDIQLTVDALCGGVQATGTLENIGGQDIPGVFAQLVAFRSELGKPDTPVSQQVFQLASRDLVSTIPIGLKLQFDRPVALYNFGLDEHNEAGIHYGLVIFGPASSKGTAGVSIVDLCPLSNPG